MDHTFHIMTKQAAKTMEYTLAVESKDELSKWWDALQQHLLDQGQNPLMTLLYCFGTCSQINRLPIQLALI